MRSASPAQVKKFDSEFKSKSSTWSSHRVTNSTAASVDIRPLPKRLAVIFIRCRPTSRLRPPSAAFDDSELKKCPVAQCHVLFPQALELEIRHRADRDDRKWDESNCHPKWDETLAHHNRESRRRFSLRLREIVNAAGGEVSHALKGFEQR